MFKLKHIILINILGILQLYIIISILSTNHLDQKITSTALTTRESAPIFPNGILVDDENNIYILSNFYGKVQVYDSNGDFKYAINPKIDGGIAFQLDETNQLMIAFTKYQDIDVYNKQGELIEQFDHQEALTKAIEKSMTKRVEISDELEYKLSNVFGYTKVTQIEDGEERVIYTISTGQYVYKLFLFFSEVFFISAIFYIIMDIKKNNVK